MISVGGCGHKIIVVQAHRVIWWQHYVPRIALKTGEGDQAAVLGEGTEGRYYRLSVSYEAVCFIGRIITLDSTGGVISLKHRIASTR